MAALACYPELSCTGGPFDVNPDPFYPKYEQPLTVPKGASELRAITYRNGCPAGKEVVIPLAELQQRAQAKEA